MMPNKNKESAYDSMLLDLLGRVNMLERAVGDLQHSTEGIADIDCDELQGVIDAVTAIGTDKLESPLESPPTKPAPATCAHVESILTLSTCHMPSSRPVFDSIRAVRHDHGYVLFITEKGPGAKCPLWLEPVVDRALRAGAQYVNFDADGLKLPGLEMWDW